MTTATAIKKDGYVSIHADGMSVINTMISCMSEKKIIKCKHAVIAASGWSVINDRLGAAELDFNIDSPSALVDWYMDTVEKLRFNVQRNGTGPIEWGSEFLMWIPGSGSLYKLEVDLSFRDIEDMEPIAIGSGEYHATGAMQIMTDLMPHVPLCNITLSGVRIACRYDPYTGGRIMHYNSDMDHPEYVIS